MTTNMSEENAKKLLFEIDTIVGRIGLTYMLYGGTCLGAIREKSFIFLDLDVDFACLIEDFVLVSKDLMRAFFDNGFDAHLVDHRHDRPWSGLPYGIKLNKYGVNADFFGWTKLGDRRFCPSHFDKFVLVHSSKYLEELRKIEFYGKKFNVPKETHKFLMEKYGNWEKPHQEFSNICEPTCRKEVRAGNDFWWI